MSLRSLLRAASPWRYDRETHTCELCGVRRVYATDHYDHQSGGWCPGSRWQSSGSRLVLAPWVRKLEFLPLALAFVALAMFFASACPAEARDQQTMLQWREPVWITWEGSCPAPDLELVRAELDEFARQALEDLEGQAVPRLGDGLVPYRIRFMVDPGCPENAAACGDRPAQWRVVRVDCDRREGVLSLNHEPMHAGCRALARLVGLIHGRPAVKVCEWADHHIGNDSRQPVLDILGRPRPPKAKPPKPAPPAPAPTPEPAVKLNKRQADVLARFPAQGWVTAQQVGADDALLRRMSAKGALQRDNQGRYRRTP